LPALTDPDLYGEGAEHAVWEILRRESPVSWQDREGFEGFWAVTSYEPGAVVLTDWERFTSTKGTLLRPDMSAPFPGAGKMLVLLDPPHHEVLKRAVWPLFTPRQIAALEGRARSTVASLLSDAIEAGECDFVTDVAAKMIVPIAADILGVPPGDIDLISSLLDAAVDNMTDVSRKAGQQAHLDLLMYYSERLAKQAGATQPYLGTRDLVSALMAARAACMDISDEEVILACDNVVVGAAETTKQAASAGLLALIEHPSQWTALQAGTVSLARAVEEILRWTAPVIHVLRTAQVDTSLLGADIRAGDPVTVWIPSLNRDASVFTDAGTFYLNREPNRHLTFGGGAHFCVGAALSRLILRVLLEELVRMTSDITLTGRPTRMRSFVNGGLSSLPTTLRSKHDSSHQ
jgi:cytochrome P450